jgi:phage replication initiation protein
MSTEAEHIELAHHSAARGARDECAAGSDGPRLVTRGETHGRDDSAPDRAAILDWLAFTGRLSAYHTLAWLASALETLFGVTRGQWKLRDRGWCGYKHRVDLGTYGLLAFGGTAQRDTYHVEIAGHGCYRVSDWNAVRLWLGTYEASLTRVDLAHDDFAGVTLSVPKALEWFNSDGFSTNGRPPTGQLIDDLGSGKGRTLYVGSRVSGKLARCYEKGRQNGDRTSPWTRIEVELRNKSRVIPLDVLTSPGKYLAGAYPALRFLCEEQCRVRTMRKVGQVSYDTMVKNLRIQGGKALHIMCKVHQGDAGAVLEKLVVAGIPKRLAKIPDEVIAGLQECSR